MAYTPSENVKKKERDYYAHLYNNNPGEFSSDYIDKANKALADIENRGEFKYNPATDIGYQSARKQYTQGGQQAMKDTLGTATELTGGYDNSYAQTAAQQTYNKYMGELAALMPQYEGQAYDRYITEGQQMKDYLGILNNALDRDYARYQDKVNAYNAETDRLYADLMDERDLDYGAYIDQRNYDYQAAQDAIANDQWERTFAHNTAMDEAAAKTAQTNADTDYLKALAGDDEGFYTYTGNVDGRSVFYRDGKEYTYDVGVNPYTGKINPDVKGKDGKVDESKVFSNGYQPNNVKGKKLKETGYKSDDNGVLQNIYTTGDGHYWLWDGKSNAYEEVENPEMDRSDLTSKVKKYRGYTM